MDLRHHRVLVVEDEILIALELRDELVDAGARVVGPAMSVAEALRLIDREKPTAAILDVWLGSEDSLKVAQRLEAVGVPFILHTGHFTDGLPRDWPQVPIIKKPASRQALLAALAGLSRAS